MTKYPKLTTLYLLVRVQKLIKSKRNAIVKVQSENGRSKGLPEAGSNNYLGSLEPERQDVVVGREQ